MYKWVCLPLLIMASASVQASVPPSVNSAWDDVSLAPVGTKLVLDKNLRLDSTIDTVFIQNGQVKTTHTNAIANDDNNIRDYIKSLKGKPVCIFFGLTDDKLKKNQGALRLKGNFAVGWDYMVEFEDQIYLACRQEMEIKVRGSGKLSLYGTKPLVSMSAIHNILGEGYRFFRSTILEPQFTKGISGADFSITLLKTLRIPGGKPLFVRADRIEMMSGLGFDSSRHTLINRSGNFDSKMTCSIYFPEQTRDLVIRSGTQLPVKFVAQEGGAMVLMLGLISEKRSGFASGDIQVACFRSTGFMANKAAVSLEDMQTFLTDLLLIEKN